MWKEVSKYVKTNGTHNLTAYRVDKKWKFRIYNLTDINKEYDIYDNSEAAKRVADKEAKRIKIQK